MESNLVIASNKVQGGKDFLALKHVNAILNVGEWETIFDCNGVEFSVVNTQAKCSSFLGCK
jgi:hypothetical protein